MVKKITKYHYFHRCTCIQSIQIWKINVIHYSLFEITQLQHDTALITVNINMHFIYLFSCMNIITHITFTLYVFLSVCASIQWWYITCLIAPQKGIILWNHGKIGGCHLLVTGMLLVVVYTIYVMNFLMAMHNATSYATCIESVNIMATDLIMLHNVVYKHGNLVSSYWTIMAVLFGMISLKHHYENRNIRRCAFISNAAGDYMFQELNVTFTGKSWRLVVDVIFQFCPIYSVHFIVFHLKCYCMILVLYEVINLVDCVWTVNLFKCFS